MKGLVARVGTASVAALTLGGCAAQVIAPPAPVVATDAAAVDADAQAAERLAPDGVARVAYPDPVGTWWQPSPEDLAAGDLAALWSLPLYATDPLGRLVPRLATSATVLPDASEGWTVEVELAAGTWSDGVAVSAADVVATSEVLRDVRPAAWAAFISAAVVGDDTVRLVFDRPFAGWAALLSDAPGILPAHVLDGGGLAAYADDLPVTGGPFTLSGVEPGVRSTFAAHPGSPLGSPLLAEVEVLVVPDHDVALGLLADDEVDAVVGHVALDPVARRGLVPDAEGATAFGGTRFELVWEPDATPAAVRRRVAADLDVAPFVEGLLRDVGRLPGGVWPVLERPAVGHEDVVEDGAAVALQVVRTVEGLGLLARRLQAELESAGVAASLVRVDPPQHLGRPVDVDGRLRVVRVAPQRSLAALLGEAGLDPSDGLAADAVGLAVDPMGERAAAEGSLAAVQGTFADDPRVLPLAEVAVAHAWHPERLAAIEPSGWPGLAFWNVGVWSVPTG